MTDCVAETIRELSDNVFRLIHRIVHDREQAMDLTQDVFVKVLLEHRHIRDKTRLKPYIFRSAYNLALNSRRDVSRRQAKAEFLKQELTIANPGQPDQFLESVETSLRLRSALDFLAPRQRETLVLRFFNELTIAEVANAMAISQGSVKVHMARGLQNLKKQLCEVP